MSEDETIDAIVAHIIAIKPTGLTNKPRTIARAQYLLDWLRAPNMEARQQLGLMVGGPIDLQTQAAEDLALKNGKEE